jgi:Polyketide cyclase / dehydrase and lipid transport
MAAFVVVRHTPLSPAAAWARVVDWSQHGRFVPLTTIAVITPPPNGLHTVFNARTRIGRFGFDDPMEVVEWAPPGPGGRGRCRLEKRGSVMTGWAELEVEPAGSGARVTWREEATPARLPRFAAGLATLSGRLLFGYVLRGLLRPPR